MLIFCPFWHSNQFEARHVGTGVATVAMATGDLGGVWPGVAMATGDFGAVWSCPWAQVISE